MPSGILVFTVKAASTLLSSHLSRTLFRSVHMMPGNRLTAYCQIDERDMEKFSTLNNSEKTITIRGDRLWSQKAKQGGGKVNKRF